jgi:hypothetical protein
LRQPICLTALLPFDSGGNAINPNAGILKISKQFSDRHPFTINADQTEIHFTLNQSTEPNRTRKLGQLGIFSMSPTFVGTLLRPGQRNLLFFTFQAKYADVNWLLVVDIRSPNDVPTPCICNTNARSVSSVLVADNLH